MTLYLKHIWDEFINFSVSRDSMTIPIDAANNPVSEIFLGYIVEKKLCPIIWLIEKQTESG